ncbi:MAG TPA: tyrosine-type recombinase/integrase [Stellaceae bacterium]|nr:tyrosine-type recombinase/integrase [Stellaceae bacterium]
MLPGDEGFYEEHQRIHATFEKTKTTDDGPKPGTITHLIASYKKSGDYLINIGALTRREYDRYLSQFDEAHGTGLVANLPREAIYKFRDEHQDTPTTANMFLQVISIILNFAEDRPLEFRLPMSWRSPARRIKRLKTGEGHRPWEEYEIADFRKTWKIGTLERTTFELYLNTGQRGEDIVGMMRKHYFEGEISVCQDKTLRRIWIPASDDLQEALHPWLESHQEKTILTTPTGLPYLSPGYMRPLMREAISGNEKAVALAAQKGRKKELKRGAELPEDCTLHGLRYSFCTRGIEVGLDWQEIASIAGHETAEMMAKYTRQRREARLAVEAMNRSRARPDNLRVSRARELFGDNP